MGLFSSFEDCRRKKHDSKAADRFGIEPQPLRGGNLDRGRRQTAVVKKLAGAVVRGRQTKLPTAVCAYSRPVGEWELVDCADRLSDRFVVTVSRAVSPPLLPASRGAKHPDR